jgi:hypothetical protein
VNNQWKKSAIILELKKYKTGSILADEVLRKILLFYHGFNLNSITFNSMALGPNKSVVLILASANHTETGARESLHSTIERLYRGSAQNGREGKITQDDQRISNGNYRTETNGRYHIEQATNQ